LIANRARHVALALLALLIANQAVFAKRPKPGFNLFSKEQDVQIGQEGMKEIEKTVKLMKNREVNEYVRSIGERLAATSEAGGYPYTFKVVWDDSINAFALPGGPTYVNTGLILAADNEGQLAGVMGHEIAHVALRHGTNQASKANLLQLGAMVGGSMLGGGSITGQLAQLGIGFGANSVLMKFSRNAERDADLLGAYMMAQAGYNPLEAARFFEKLEAEAGNRSGVAQFFSSHPNPGNRTERIEKEIQYMERRSYDGDTGQLERIKAIIRGAAPPEGTAPGQQPPGPPPQEPPQAAPAPQQPATAPSSRQQAYQGREFQLAYPENWRAFGQDGQVSVTFAPEDGIVQAQGGGTAIARGAVANMMAASRGQSVNLERDTGRLIEQLRQGNPGMKAANRQPRAITVDGSPGLLTTLYSPSPFPGQTEVDMLLTVARPQGLYYMVFIAPQSEFRQHQAAFESILRSIKFSQ